MRPKKIPIKVHLSTKHQSIDASVPTTVHVPYAPDQDVVLEWIAVGDATFPENAVKWEGARTRRSQPRMGATPHIVSCDDPWRPPVSNGGGVKRITSAVYRNDCQNAVNWPYSIRIENGGAKVTIDPEVANDPPGAP